jgi:hypothetical protein
VGRYWRWRNRRRGRWGHEEEEEEEAEDGDGGDGDVLWRRGIEGTAEICVVNIMHDRRCVKRLVFFMIADLVRYTTGWW